MKALLDRVPTLIAWIQRYPGLVALFGRVVLPANHSRILATGAIAAAEQADSEPRRRERPAQREDERSLSRSAHEQVADHEYRNPGRGMPRDR